MTPTNQLVEINLWRNLLWETDVVHLLFEQSGTFKRAFKKLGMSACDYDFENRFDETDFMCDIFNEIDLCIENEPSVLDNIISGDIVIAFFPCTYFSVQNDLIFNKTFKAFKNWSDERIQKYVDDRLYHRDYYYKYFLKLIEIGVTRKWKLIIENPYRGNYLRNFHKPSLIIHDRSVLGDNHKKPTMFFTYNFNFKNNDIGDIKNEKDIKIHSKYNTFDRNMIHEDFAKNFILKYIIGE